MPPLPPQAWTAFEEWAARLGQYAWFEQQIFGLLGQWSARSPEPDACIVLARHARHRAWHAELWDGLLPTVAGIDATSLVRPPNDAIAALMADLASDPSPTATEDFPAGIYRVVGPGLASTYDDHGATASPVAEAPTIRVLDRVRRDQTVDLEEGRRLLERLARDAGSGKSGSDLDHVRDRWNGALPKGWRPVQLGSAGTRR